MIDPRYLSALRRSWRRVSGVTNGDDSFLIVLASVLCNLDLSETEPLSLVLVNPWRGPYFRLQRCIATEFPFVVPIKNAFKRGGSWRYLSEWESKGARILSPEDLTRFCWSAKRVEVFRFLRRVHDGYRKGGEVSATAGIGFLATVRQLELFAILPELQIFGGRLVFLRPLRAQPDGKPSDSAVDTFRSMLRGLVPELEGTSAEFSSVEIGCSTRFEAASAFLVASGRVRGMDLGSRDAYTERLKRLCKAVSLIRCDRRVSEEDIATVFDVAFALLTDREWRSLALLFERRAFDANSALRYADGLRQIHRSPAVLLAPLERAGMIVFDHSTRKHAAWLSEDFRGVMEGMDPARSIFAQQRRKTALVRRSPRLVA